MHCDQEFSSCFFSLTNIPGLIVLLLYGMGKNGVKWMCFAFLVYSFHYNPFSMIAFNLEGTHEYLYCKGLFIE